MEIKKTKSLSPVSGRVIDASVVLDDGRVYLVKQDENGTVYKSLIEQDYEFYRMMTADTVTEQVKSSVIFLYVSDRCNLNCPICYESGQHHQELSLAEMATLSKQLKNKSLVIMGKEPTCHENVFEFIKLAKRKNRPMLVTNGIKLADYDYAARLKQAGLSIITLTFNGFDDKIHEALSGRPLLDIKLKALSNIKKTGLRTTISTSLTRGVNDNQIKRLTDFCFENRSFISQLRLRTAQKVGACVDVEPFTMSELLNLFSDALDIPREDIIKEHLFWKDFIKELGPLAPPKVQAIIRARLCAFSITVIRNKNKYSCLGSYVDIEKLKNARFKKVRYLYKFLRTLGPRYITEYIWALMDIPFKPGNADHLMVGFRCWPNIYNIDLQENRKCPSMQYKHGEFIPFCYSNIIEARSQSQGVTS